LTETSRVAQPSRPGNAPRVRATMVAVAAGTLGGAALSRTGLPLAWLLGAMAASIGCALAGVRLHVPDALRSGMLAVLGILVGATFTPDVLGRIAQWPAMLVLLALFVALATALGTVFFRKAGGYDWKTAYFAALPGGVAETTMTAEATGADVRAVSVAHTLRLAGVVFLVPLYFRLTAGFVAGTSGAPARITHAIGPLEALVLIASGIIGVPLARLARLPAAPLLGPLIASAALHLGGLSHVRPPVALVNAAQVVLGAAIGVRFAGTRISEMGRMLMVSSAWIVVVLALAVATSLLAAPYVTLDHNGILLSLTPGGLAEMSIIALALGIDTAFVSTLQIARYFLVILSGPLIYRVISRHRYQDLP